MPSSRPPRVKTPTSATQSGAPKPNAVTHYIANLVGDNRSVHILLFYSLTKGITMSLYSLVFSLYLYSLGYKQDVIGLLTAVPAVTVLIFGLPTGLLADRIGRKPLLIAGTVLNPLTFLGVALSPSLPWLVFWGLMNGITASGYWVTAFPLLTEHSRPEQRVGIFAANSLLLWGIGAMGNAIGGIIPQIVGQTLHVPAMSPQPLRIALFAVVIFGWLGVIPLPWLREQPEVHREGESASPTKAASPDPPIRPPGYRRWPIGLFARLLGPDIVLAFGNGAMVGFLQLYFVVRFGLSTGFTGSYFAAAGLIAGFASLAAPLLSHRLGTLRAVVILFWVSIPIVLGEGLAPVALLALLAEGVRTCLRSTIDPIYTTFAMERVPASQRATLSGLYSVTWSIGFSLGPAASGWVQVRTHSFAPAFLMAAGCFLLAATAFYVFFGRSSIATRRGEVAA